MSKPMSIALYTGGALIVLTMAPIIALTAFRLVHIVFFGGTVDGSIIAFILLMALLPAGIGIALFGYFLHHQIRGFLGGGTVAKGDYIGRFLARRASRGDE